jgi:very-short-patch-repair endonuclease
MYRDQEQREFARRLRHQMTEAETRLWRLLRAQQVHGYKFRRQAAIGAYVVDFVCFSEKLVVELDGPQHQEAEAREHDERRTEWLESRGFRVIRFRNHEVDEDIHAVMDVIVRGVLKANPAECSPPPQPSPPRGGSRKNNRV